MAKIKIDKGQLVKLREYFIKGGSNEADDVLAQLGTEDEAVMNAYIAELKIKYPVDFDPDYVAKEDEDEEEEETFQFFYDNGDGILVEMEKVREKKGKIYFKKLEPKDLVEIIVKGKTVTVDLIQLAKKAPAMMEHGVRVDQLIQLAKLAKE